MKYYSALKKDILTYVAARMNLQDAVLNETAQSQKDRCYMMESICGT